MNAKCKCRQCDQKIEFDSSRAGENVTCPNCGMDTLLFVPQVAAAYNAFGPCGKTPEPEFSVDKKNVVIIFTIIGLLSFIGFVLVLCDPEAHEEVNAPVFLLLSICGGILYFIPALVGSRKKQFPALFALNFLLGWTFIGWVGALVWALIKDSKSAS